MAAENDEHFFLKSRSTALVRLYGPRQYATYFTSWLCQHRVGISDFQHFSLYHSIRYQRVLGDALPWMEGAKR